LAAKEHHVKRLLHLSALTNNKKSRYAETKLRAQKEVLSIFPQATIVRPSLIYGREGKFINVYARVVTKSLFVPLLWGGHTRTQPLYVEDVALFLYVVLGADSSKVCGKILNIVGPKQYEMLEILNFVLHTLNKKRVIIPLPGWAGYALGYLCDTFGIKFMTSDLVTLMKENFLLSEGEVNAMPDFGVKAKYVEEVVPPYLAQVMKTYGKKVD
jgi:NADH dehydrogenase